jgi:hypothetical protein
MRVNLFTLAETMKQRMAGDCESFDRLQISYRGPLRW